jgi:hypothetical protein
LWNEGVQTAAERQLGIMCLNYCEVGTGVDTARDRDPLENVEKVFLLAGAWGVNPFGDVSPG